MNKAQETEPGSPSFRDLCEKVGFPFALGPKNQSLTIDSHLWYIYFCRNRQAPQ